MSFLIVSMRLVVVARGYRTQSSFKNTDFWDLTPERQEGWQQPKICIFNKYPVDSEASGSYTTF